MLRRVGLAQRHNIEQLCILNRLTDSSSSLTSLGRPLRHQRCNASAAQVRRKSVTKAPQYPGYAADGQGSSDPVTTSLPSTSNGDAEDVPANPHLPRELYILLQNMVVPSKTHEAALEKFLNIPLIRQSISERDAALQIARALATSPKPLKAIHFLYLAHAAGFNIPPNVYHEVVFHLAAKRLWRGVLATVQLGRELLKTTTVRLLNWKVRALVETRQYAALKCILDEYSQYSLKPQRRTYHLLLSGHVQNRDLTSAKRVLAEMKAANIPPDPSTDAIIATHYRGLGADPRVEVRTLRTLQTLKPRTATSVVNRLILFRLDAHDTAGAIQLLGLFDSHHIECVRATSTIQSAIDHGRSRSIVSTAGNRNLIPNADTYTIFLNLMANQRNYGDGIQIFRGMLNVGIEPTVTTVTALVNLLFATGRGDTAVKLVARMCSDTTNVALWEPFLSCKTPKDFPWDPSDIRPNIKIFNMLLRRLLPTHGLHIVRPMLQIMDYNKVNPNTATLEILLSHLYKDQRAQPGKLVDTLRRFTSADLQPTVRHLHFVLASLLRHQKYLLLGEGWKRTSYMHRSSRADTRQDPPEHLISNIGNPFDPTAGIQFAPGVNLPERSKGILARLKENKETSDTVILAHRIRHEALVNFDPVAAKEVLQVILNRGMRPNEYHFSALMEGLAQADDMDGAWEALKTARHVGCEPNATMFTILISGYARKGNPDMALKTFENMVESGIHPDVGSIDAVVSAFFAVGLYRACRGVLMRLWNYIQPFPSTLQRASLQTLVQHFRQLDEGFRNPRQLTEVEGKAMQKELREIRRIWRASWKTRSGTDVDAEAVEYNGLSSKDQL